MDEQKLDQSTYHVLKAVKNWPQDMQDPLFAAYPAMKLGQRAAIDFYAGKLAEAVHHIQLLNPSTPGWVILTPPVYHLPAGASLMARAVARKCGHLDVVEPHLTKAIAANGYAMAGLSVRADNRRRQDEALDRPLLEKQLRGRPVIVINDINVTGTQEAFLTKLLVDVGVSSCHWSYVFTVDQELGARYPQLEHELNTSQLRSLEEFTSLLALADTIPTARCIERLFDLPMVDFTYLADRLTSKRRAELRSLAVGEARYGGAIFAAKLALLEKGAVHV